MRERVAEGREWYRVVRVKWSWLPSHRMPNHGGSERAALLCSSGVDSGFLSTRAASTASTTACYRCQCHGQSLLSDPPCSRNRFLTTTCMLSTSRPGSAYLLPRASANSLAFSSLRRSAGCLLAPLGRPLSSASQPSFARLLLPVSLSLLCLPVPSVPLRHVFFMAWSAKHSPAQPLPRPRTIASLLAAVSVVAVVLVAVVAVAWQRMYAAMSPRSALSSIAALTAVSSSVVACRECSSDSNAGLIDNMMRRGVLHSQEVAAAMKRVDRRHYITPAAPATRQLHPSSAYVDSPQYIGTALHLCTATSTPSTITRCSLHSLRAVWL